MGKNFSLGKWWCALAFVLAFVTSPWAWAGIFAPGVGNGPDRPDDASLISPSSHGGLHTDPPFLGTGWDVGSRTSRITITADPTAPNWIKVLQLPPTQLFPFNTLLNLNEFLHIGPGLDWTDWHETITTPGWEWGAAGSFGTPTQAVLAPSRTDANSDGLFETAEFFVGSPGFPPGSDVGIGKQLHCGALLGCSGEPVLGHGFGIVVREFPTTAIPEPSTWLLLVAGLAGLAALRRRRA